MFGALSPGSRPPEQPVRLNGWNSERAEKRIAFSPSWARATPEEGARVRAEAIERLAALEAR